MKLLNSFFSVSECSKTLNLFRCKVVIDPTHVVYKGHFPGYPVTPGVIQIQMIHELLDYFQEKEYKLSEITDCKFLKIMNPNVIGKLEVEIEIKELENELHVKAQIKDDVALYFKYRGICMAK